MKRQSVSELWLVAVHILYETDKLLSGPSKEALRACTLSPCKVTQIKDHGKVAFALNCQPELLPLINNPSVKRKITKTMARTPHIEGDDRIIFYFPTEYRL
jgi:hypothetical protein